jgi:hypothetical protein
MLFTSSVSMYSRISAIFPPVHYENTHRHFVHARHLLLEAGDAAGHVASVPLTLARIHSGAGKHDQFDSDRDATWSLANGAT